jgi:ATP-dependent helicase/nuclease subunit B
MNFSEKIYSIAPQENYLRNLAQFILNKTSNDAVLLTKSKVFVPNRRSVTRLKEEFLKLSENNACILPEIYAIGDLDENEFEISLLDDEVERQIKPAISKIERKAILTKLIMDNRNDLSGDEFIFNLEHATNLANSLLSFFDEVERNELPFAKLEEVVPEDLSEHWNKSLKFLKLAGEAYPKILEERGLSDPICRRNAILNLYSETLKQKNHKGYIFIAGSTGSQNAVRRFIANVLGLENGYLVLPYTDISLSQQIYSQLGDDENHLNHQYLIFELLKFLKVEINNIKSKGNANTEYAKLVSEIFKPSSEVIGWSNYKIDEPTAKKIKLIEAETIVEEAKAICLILREAIENRKTALVVCNNNELVNYIQSNMLKYNVKVDFTGGTKLLKTPTAKFFSQIAKLIGNKFRSADFLALVKSPFCKTSTDIRIFKHLISEVETKIIRRKKIKFCDNLLEEIKLHKGFSSSDIEVFDNIFKTLNHLKFLYLDSNTSINTFLNEHIKVAESFDSELFESDEGKELRAALNNIITAKELDNIFGIEEYPSVIDNLLNDVTYREKYGFAEKIAITTTIEARLQDADVVILTDLNEGSWPRITEDNWLSEEMKRKFGLPGIERSIALATHDFTSLMFAESLFITRSVKAFGGGINAPSPLLLRIKTFYETHNILKLLTPEINYTLLAKNFDGEFEQTKKIEAPSPTPPFEARPRGLSVTKIEKLFKNPYSIYASEILKLKPLDEVEEDENIGQFGTILHKIFEEFVKHHQLDESKITVTSLMQIANEVFAEFRNSESYNIWKGKFEDIADWFVKEEKERVKNISKIHTESTHSHQFKVKGEVFNISAKADRIELWRDNAVNIIDYKSNAPSENKVKELFKPQLLLEALILKNSDGFIDSNFKITYYDLNKHEVKELLKDGLNECVDNVEAELLNILNDVLDTKKPFLSNPFDAEDLKDKYDEYAHLARVKEWK